MRGFTLFSRIAGSLLPLLWGCACAGSDAGRPAATDSVYVGLAVADAADPRPYQTGAELALVLLNEARAPEEAPLAVRLPPPDAATVTSMARALRDDPDVVGVVGHATDAPTLEAARIYEDGRAVAVVSPTAAHEGTAAASPWVFRLAPTTRTVARASARFALDSLSAPRSAVLYPNDAAGREFVGEFARVFIRGGGAVVERDPYLEESAFAAYVPRLVQRGASGLIVAGRANQLLAATRMLLQTGGPMPILLAPEPWEVVAASPAPGVATLRVAVAFDPDRPRSREAARFLAAYTRRYGIPVDPRAALAYDAAMLIGQAAREAGTDRGLVRDWIARTGRGRPAHLGATGSVVFDGDGNAVNKSVVFMDLPGQ